MPAPALQLQWYPRAMGAARRVEHTHPFSLCDRLLVHGQEPSGLDASAAMPVVQVDQWPYQRPCVPPECGLV
ncbi:MAG: hypothetical protein SGPRY_008801 [Prymnesium sp.]